MSFSANDIPESPDAIEAWIDEREKRAPKIKEGARASVIWADPEKKTKTKYSIVYLHGFKASHAEGNPVHKHIARHFGCNLFLSRLEGHGLHIEKPLSDIDSNSFIQSAIEALAIGEKIGRKVIIMGTSTGGSLALYLAGQSSLNQHIEALLLYSPLIKFYGSTQWLLGNSFLRTILNGIPGRNYMITSQLGFTKAEKKIWYHSYALQGALALGKLIETEMTDAAFAKVKCPVFIGYYFKNSEEQDKVVSVAAIKSMARKLGVKGNRKILKNFPNARTHVICSGLLSKSIPEVESESIQFLEKIIGVNES